MQKWLLCERKSKLNTPILCVNLHWGTSFSSCKNRQPGSRWLCALSNCPMGQLPNSNANPTDSNVNKKTNERKMDQMLRRAKSQTQLKRHAYLPFFVFYPTVLCHPASRQPPPDRQVSGHLLWAHGPLACCGPISWCSCHLPSRVVFCINLAAAGAKWSVQCVLIYAFLSVCMFGSVCSFICAIYTAAETPHRQAVTQTKTDV